MKTSDIKITVGLDENNVPEKLFMDRARWRSRTRRSQSYVVIGLG